MARDKLTEYSATASENTVCGDVNIAENSALPSDMNNFAREVMSHLKAFSDGTDAIDALTVTGDLTVDTNTLHVDAANNRVGVGTTSPGGAKLYVQGGQVIARYDHTTTSLSGNTNLTAFPHSLAVYNGNGTGTGNLASIGFSIDTTGSVTNGAIVGHSTAAGSMDLAFYTESSNAIGERGRFLAGGGLTFNGDTAAANALDDYEEGIWTPAFEMVSGSASFSYQVNGQKGYYTKVGRQVSILFSIHSAGATVTTDGPVRISGLPFTSANLSNGKSYSLGFKQLLDTNEVGLLLAINVNDSKIELYEGHQNYPESHRHIDASMLENDRRIRGTMTYFV